MNYHVFIVNNTTFQYHLRYGFAGTGAGNREVSFLSKPETSFNYAVETNFVKMIADISRIRAGDKILFYLCATPTTQGAFYGVFKASSSAFFDESNANNYLRHELGKPLAFLGSNRAGHRIPLRRLRAFISGFPGPDYTSARDVLEHDIPEVKRQPRLYDDYGIRI